jgi:hypothetical protein
MKEIDYKFGWPEIVGFILLLVGLMISLSIGSSFLTYVSAFLFGLIFGRIWYQQRKDRKVPYLIITAGFIVGYIVGTYYGSRTVTVVIFLLGGAISYYIHKKGYVPER